jgi:hypothetical protein
MSLLAGRLGYVRLAQPVRFRAPWEQAATLRLRDGDTSVLAEYDQHARITGGEPDQTGRPHAGGTRHLACATPVTTSKPRTWTDWLRLVSGPTGD